MATTTSNEWLDAMLGDWVHSFIDLNTDTIKASLLDQTDSGTITATTVVYSEVNAATVVASGALPTVSSITDGVVTLGSALTFSAVSGDAADYLVAWKDSADPATSPLIITWDSASSGLPVTPNGGDIVATWSSNIFATLA